MTEDEKHRNRVRWLVREAAIESGVNITTMQAVQLANAIDLILKRDSIYLEFESSLDARIGVEG